MWLAELLGRERGEEVQLKNAPLTQWVCDPHTKVHFCSCSTPQIAEYSAAGTLST